MAQTINIGHMSAWSLARSRGYTGTREEFAELMASYATVAEQANQSATDAETAKGTAQQAATDAQTAQASAQEFAQSAQQSAQSASQSATDAESAKDTAVDAVDGFAAGARQALDGVNQAGINWKSLAEAQKLDSEAWAVGQRDGEDVGSSDPAYHNNAKYYAESVSASAQTATEAAQTATQKAGEAAQSASAAAESARTLTIDATLTRAGQAADSKAVGERITDLKSAFNGITEPTRNLWTFGDQSFTYYKPFGSAGHTLFPAGEYTVSANIISTETANRVVFLAYDSTNTAYTVYLDANRGSRSQRSFMANNPIERIYLYAGKTTGESTGKDSTWSNIQLEPGLVATEYVVPFSAVDLTARNALTEIQTESTRNLWTYGNQSFTKYTDLRNLSIPAGDYSMSALVATETAKSRVCFFDSNGAQITYIEFVTKSHRQIRALTLTTDCVRIVIYSGINTSGSEGYSATYDNIQLELNTFYGYTNSSATNWGHMPFATEYINPQNTIAHLAEQWSKSYWTGKIINFNGDSVTQGVSSDGDRIGYVSEVIKELQFGQVNNYAIGGTRMAHVEGESNCMVDRYQSMSTNCDIVYIMANTNDYASQVPIGSADSTDITTYNGAMNTIFTWLKQTYKTQPIIISTMLTRKVNYSDGQPLPIGIEQYAQAVRDRCSDYGFILFDAYKLSGLDLLNSPTDGTGITDDGLHPNYAGALALGRKVAKFISEQ